MSDEEEIIFSFLKNFGYLFLFLAALAVFAVCELSLVLLNSGYSLFVVCGLPIAVTSLGAEHGL